MFSAAPLVLDSSYPLDRVMADYLKANSPIAPALEGRIVNCNKTATDAMCPAVVFSPPSPTPPSPKPPSLTQSNTLLSIGDLPTNASSSSNGTVIGA